MQKSQLSSPSPPTPSSEEEASPSGPFPGKAGEGARETGDPPLTLSGPSTSCRHPPREAARVGRQPGQGDFATKLWSQAWTAEAGHPPWSPHA